jgi:hypothetical protein
MPIRVAIYEDNRALREALEIFISQEPDVSVHLVECLGFRVREQGLRRPQNQSLLVVNEDFGAERNAAIGL